VEHLLLMLIADLLLERISGGGDVKNLFTREEIKQVSLEVKDSAM
jgi:hypothetical protein